MSLQKLMTAFCERNGLVPVTVGNNKKISKMPVEGERVTLEYFTHTDNGRKAAYIAVEYGVTLLVWYGRMPRASTFKDYSGVKSMADIRDERRKKGYSFEDRSSGFIAPVGSRAAKPVKKPAPEPKLSIHVGRINMI